MLSLAVAPRQERPKTAWLQRLLKGTGWGRQDWQGGIRLPGHKDLSNKTPIQSLSLAGVRLDIPLVNGRSRAEACVTVGQAVKKGEVIWRGPAGTVWVHASTSGVVCGLGEVRLAESDEPVACVSIEADGLDQWLAARAPAPSFDPAQLADFALQMGLVGLGGAGFPTGLKLAPRDAELDTLLINGAECEPFITCDDRLMRERAADIIATADYLGRVYSLKRVAIGVEPNKPEALASLRAVARAAGSAVEVVALPCRYPAGGQPLLVKSLSGRVLGPGMLPAELGLLVMNVATVYALGRAVFHGEPLVSRVVTLTGHVEQAGNVEAPVGLAVSHLLERARPRAGERGVQVGGPMMGRLLSHPEAVIGKTSSCLIVRSDELFPPRAQSGDCIRCNRCVDVCPMALQPLKLYEATNRADRQTLQQEQLGACIECGTCSQVCPSNLPLRDSFRHAKRTIWLGAVQ
ncbi:electron transport complex subunit RsxC [Pseudogulbenkiania subflava]|uniref:electron transport complex subunit RsxC n=1 Tax=Pseudogulbenkiania subflava TaxID=451637 RepID=UPI00190E6026|nr:electron transport complex subunit RsxC [Pseudogulbenkiania subflava]